MDLIIATIITITLCVCVCAYARVRNNIAFDVVAIITVALAAPMAARAIAVEVFDLPLIEWWIIMPVGALASWWLVVHGVDMFRHWLQRVGRRGAYRSEVKSAARGYKVIFE